MAKKTTHQKRTDFTCQWLSAARAKPASGSAAASLRPVRCQAGFPFTGIKAKLTTLALATAPGWQASRQRPLTPHGQTSDETRFELHSYSSSASVTICQWVESRIQSPTGLPASVFSPPVSPCSNVADHPRSCPQPVVTRKRKAGTFSGIFSCRDFESGFLNLLSRDKNPQVRSLFRGKTSRHAICSTGAGFDSLFSRFPQKMRSTGR